MSTMPLFTHEMERILEALRRDARREDDLAHTDPEWAEVHRANARHDRDLLEVLNPKRSSLPAPRICGAAGCPLYPIRIEIAHQPTQESDHVR